MISDNIICLSTLLENPNCFLAKAKDVFPHVNQIESINDPLFYGTPDEYITTKGIEFEHQLKNKVLSCTGCGKSNAFTMIKCNQCHNSLEGVKISKTNNVFTSFIYGIQKGPFPLFISTRYADNEILVYDDLLQVTPCHINAIPANIYCPDWRYLLLSPQEGLELLKKLLDTAWHCIRTQFLTNTAWKNKIFKNAHTFTDDDFKSFVLVGCNFPPSQNHLHLQVLLPPYRPLAWYAAKQLDGRGRFCPYSYLTKILSFSDEIFPVTENTSLTEIFEYFKKKGVDYDAEFDAHKVREAELQVKLVNWQLEDFEGVVVEGKKFYVIEGENAVKVEGEVDIEKITREDTVILQNYGRPYKNGKPTGGYYKYAKTELLESFPVKSKHRL